MKFKIITESPVKQKFVLAGEAEYTTRLQASTPIELAVGGVEKIPARSFVIALDENGTEMTSEAFAEFLRKKTVSGTSHFTFLIGGASGLPDAMRKKAAATIALSKLTFTYQMTRLILVEQLYRAVSIIQGKPYHKE
jgi:23S rRNA (pseudouridine1915-N3)-methyltransferase